MANHIEYLKEQIAHCERMARAVFDEITSDYLLAFAAECRKDLAALTCASTSPSAAHAVVQA